LFSASRDIPSIDALGILVHCGERAFKQLHDGLIQGLSSCLKHSAGND
jgi:hypothetical protein